MPIQRIAVRIPKVLNTLLLDLYPNAAVAYSLRKLRTAYTGNAIRVRRSSDNAEQNIGFVGNDLDTQTMLDFVGYNLFTYSEDMFNVAWVKTQLNTTGTPPYSNVTTAPDGTLTADKIIENTASTTTHYVTRTTQGSITNLANYNLSVYLKAGERTKVVISSNIPNFNVDHSCTVDLTNGTISNNTFTNTPIMESVGNGWYRFSVSMVSTVTASSRPLRIQLLNELDQGTYTGDGTSGCFMWGAQLSKTSDLKPYTRTFADATRSAFVTTWYDQSGNGNNLTKTTAVNQPYIVSAGSLVIDNGTPAVKFDGTNDSLVTTNTFTQSQPITSFGLFKVSTNKNYVPIYGFGSSGLISLVDVTQYSVNSLRIGATGGSGANFEVNHILNKSINLNTYYIASALYNTPNFSFTLNNNISTGTSGVNTLSLSNNNFSIGNQFAYGYTDATVKEVVVYFSNQSANITNIQSNINSHYNIY